MDLITDRTYADCERAQYLLDKMHAGETLTDAERAEYFGGLRGAYTMAHDWNRVEAAVEEISNAYGMQLETKTNWTYNDIATQDEVERYLNNVRHIRGYINSELNLPEAPTLDDWIDYRAANAIEMILSMAAGNIVEVLLAASDEDLLMTSDGKYLCVSMAAGT